MLFKGIGEIQQQAPAGIWREVFIIQGAGDGVNNSFAANLHTHT